MKFKKLLVLTALALTGTSAWAVDPNVWTEPVLPAITEFIDYQEVTSTDDGSEVYLYNVNTGMFFASGSYWGTRATLLGADAGGQNGATGDVMIRGNKVWLLRSADAIASGEGVVEIKNYVPKHKDIRSAFAAGWDGVWTDNNSETHRYWKFIPMGDKTYRIQNSTFESSTERYLGWLGTSDYNLYLLEPKMNTDGVYGMDWKIVAPAVYEAWLEALPYKKWSEFEAYKKTYNMAMELKAALEEAETKGVAVADQLAVYNNTASTQAQLKEAIAAVKQAVAQSGMSGASAANPVDATGFIKNSNFAYGDNSDWSGTPDKWVVNGASLNAELFNKDKIDVYQKITGLTNGVYAVGASAFYRAGDPRNDTNEVGPSYKNFVLSTEAARYAKLYAFNGTDTLFNAIVSPFYGAPSAKQNLGTEATGNADSLLWIPNNMDGAEGYMHKLDLYKNKVFTTVEDGTLTIGMFKAKKTNYDWLLADDFTLTYYGTGADAYQKWSDEILESLKVWYPAEGVLLTDSYKDAFTATLTGKTATTRAEAVANIAAAQEALQALGENTGLWSEWQDQLKLAQEACVNPDYQDLEGTEFDDLLDYATTDEGFDAEFKAILAAHNLDNEALKAEVEKVKKLIKDVDIAFKSQIPENTDVTEKFLTNPDFDKVEIINGNKVAKPEEGWKGWFSAGSMPKHDGFSDVNSDKYNITAEAWNTATFDLYQEVEDAPAGVYEISVQGFYRYGRGDDAWKAYKAQEVDYVKPGGAPVYVYMNDVATPFPNVYEDGEELSMETYVDMAQVENGEPKMNGDVYVWETGLKHVQNCPSDVPVAFYPNGMTSAAVAFGEGKYTRTAKSLLAKRGDKLRIGVKGTSNQLGDSWAIWDNFKLTYLGFEVESVKPVLEKAIADAQKKLEKNFGSDVRAELETMVDAALALVEAEDGKAMFKAAADLVAVPVDSSIILYNNLKTERDAFETYAREMSKYCSEQTFNAAQTLYNEIYEKLEAASMTDAEMKSYLEQMEELRAQLKIVDGMENASDDNEVNATPLITNYDYAKGNDNGWTGGATVDNNQVAEMYNKTFDYYQELTNLLPGTYIVGVQGFYRAGTSTEDYDKWTKNPSADNNVILYAKVGETTYSSLLKRLASETNEVELMVGEEIYKDWADAYTDTIAFEPDTIVKHYLVPFRVWTGNDAFNDGYYVGNEVTFKVGEDGKATIGLKKTAEVNVDWTLWDNWTLKYYGANSTKEVSTGLKGIAAEGVSVVKTEIYSLTGTRVKSGRGLVIMKQTMSDGSIRVKKVIK